MTLLQYQESLLSKIGGHSYFTSSFSMLVEKDYPFHSERTVGQVEDRSSLLGYVDHLRRKRFSHHMS